ncbi:MAG: hypothetical protein ACK58C_03980, partial [Betaproteobacteria bacterium]
EMKNHQPPALRRRPYTASPINKSTRFATSTAVRSRLIPELEKTNMLGAAMPRDYAIAVVFVGTLTVATVTILFVLHRKLAWLR